MVASRPEVGAVEPPRAPGLQESWAAAATVLLMGREQAQAGVD